MAISTFDFEYVRKLVEQGAAIVLGDEKKYLVEARLDMLAQSLGLSRSVLLDRVRLCANWELRQQVVEAMTTNETWFFRDQNPFESLRTHVLPKLIEARSYWKRLYLWSAACSTGQEPYSLTILLREHFPELHDWNITLLATDLNSAVLERARRGRYNEVELQRGLSPDLIRKYFRQEGTEWVLDDAVRSMVEFRQLNLKTSWPPLPYMDLVLLRNVLIYFSATTKREILAQVRSILRPGGYLMLGSSETTHFLDETYQSVQCGPSVCYQVPAQTTQAA